MVIHDESGLEVIPPVLENQLYGLNPNNNEQYYENTNENDAPMSEPIKKSRKLSGNESDGKVRNSRKKLNKTDHPSAYPSENSDSTSSTNKISPEDLEELRNVYKKCKSVIRKIETKYGHLLDLEPAASKRRRKNTENPTDEDEAECQCTLNKKIVFDDDGQEIAIDTVPAGHICPKKQRFTQSQTAPPHNDLQIEYYNQHIELPDTLQELKTILQNPGIEITYRNQVIQKVRLIKQEYAFEIKFNKHSIVEKIKTDMNEMIDFKGTNLSSLPGYIY
ncbi:Uncharacterized protein OBRU01_02105 [Operophtera brumata]|uniref:Uncharacterized protein n=1 Tax=Operophtera brumata TaxID=104452 RepID=A0A0L7LT24_OPEBR|nr:Uncharacterized protein OBRU01_02105 [Operophtera brumata]